MKKKNIIINNIILIIIIILLLLLTIKYFNIYKENFSSGMIDLDGSDYKVFSQNGEDGIIEAIFNAIGTTNKYYVEFGTESGSEINTRYLREKKGWDGLLLDGSNENFSINLRKHFIDAENIVDLFKKYNVPNNFDLLSVDIDRNDWYVLKSIIAPTSDGYQFRPRVIIVEYNSEWKPPEDKVVIYDPSAMWDKTNYFSASLTAYANLGKYCNYTVVYADKKGVNLFFVANEEKPLDLFKNAGNNLVLYRSPTYLPSTDNCKNKKYGHCDDTQNRKYLKSIDLLK